MNPLHRRRICSKQMRRQQSALAWGALEAPFPRRPAALAAGLAAVFVLACARTVAGADSTAGDTPSGRAVYDRDCAVCHGADGRGGGPAAARLSVPARDFTKGRYKFRSTASGQPPTDEDLRRSIVHGLRGTAMVPQNHLSDAEVDAVITFIKSLSPVFSGPTAPHQLALPKRPEGDLDLGRGKHIFHEAGCDGCHGAGGAGDGVVAKDLSQAPANLTRRPLKGGSDTVDILRAVVTGLDDTPMPSYHLLYDDADMWALAAYVASLGGAETLTDEERLGWEIERRDPQTGKRLAD